MAKTLKTSDSWEPPASLSKEELVKISDGILAEPDIPYTETEDVFRIHANGMDWDIGCMVYEPKDPAKIPTGPDGNKLGIFMTHGGASDWRSIERLAQTFAGKRGYKVCSMTYPGRLYLPDPSRDWPGDTFHDDGGVRTPIWLDGEFIGRDEYEVGRRRRPAGDLRLPEVRQGQEGKQFLLSHGGLAGGVRGRHAGHLPPAPARGRVLGVHPRPFHRRTLQPLPAAAHRERQGPHRHRELAFRVSSSAR